MCIPRQLQNTTLDDEASLCISADELDSLQYVIHSDNQWITVSRNNKYQGFKTSWDEIEQAGINENLCAVLENYTSDEDE